MATGLAREIAIFGARGDGKTWAALWAMVMHAVEHHRAGFPLPTTWLALRDTHQNHLLSTRKSMTSPGWPKNAHWVMSEGDHVATFLMDGVEFVRVELVGANSPADAEKIRTECHGLWVDEPAPAMGLSNGITDELYYMANSSARLETHARVTMITSNYPEEDHWAAVRFHFDPQPGTLCFRVPAGERASEEYRAELKRLYATRPDLAKRLVHGHFGSVMLGQQVAVGFTRDTHVRPCKPSPGFPVWIGQDGGHTPTAVIGQRVDGRVRIIGALTSEDWGMEQFVQQLLRPWLGEFAPWSLDDPEYLRIVYDPSIDKGSEADINANALSVLRRHLRATYRMGPVSWDDRKNAMLSLLNDMAGGDPVLQIDPIHAKGLIKALDGGWYYALAPDGGLKRADTVKDSVQPKKPNHPHEDFGDAFCYLVAGMAPARAPRPEGWKPEAAKNLGFDPRTYQRKPKARGVGFSPLRLR